jgi:hypothetical protein
MSGAEWGLLVAVLALVEFIAYGRSRRVAIEQAAINW